MQAFPWSANSSLKNLMEIPSLVTSEKASGRRTRRTLARTVFSRELALATLTIFIIFVFWILYPTSFANFRNFSAILRNLAFEGILAIGMMIGSMASIGVVTGALMKMWNTPVPLAVATGLLMAALGGFINGFIVAKVRVNALITTLGTMGIFQGIALLIGGPGSLFCRSHFPGLDRRNFLGCRARSGY